MGWFKADVGGPGPGNKSVRSFKWAALCAQHLLTSNNVTRPDPLSTMVWFRDEFTGRDSIYSVIAPEKLSHRPWSIDRESPPITIVVLLCWKSFFTLFVS